MKKLLWITAIVALLTACICIPALAGTTAPAAVTLQTDNDSPAQGATVTVTVALSGSAKAKSMLIVPVYDPNILELQSGEWLLTDGILTDNWSPEFGDAAIAYSSETDMNGDVFKLVFRVLNTAALGNTRVDCTVTIKNGQELISNSTTPANLKIVCGTHSYAERVEAAFLKTPADCTHKAVYYKSCSACGEKGTATFEVGNVLGHLWGSVYSYNAQGHYHTCTREGCKEAETAVAHSYSGYTSTGSNTHTATCVCGKVDTSICSGGTATCQTKASCLICGGEYGNFADHDYDVTVWGYQEDAGHARVCKTPGCNAHDSIRAHISGGPATEDAAEICTDCAYVITPATGHIQHTPADTWYYDADTHWKECVGCTGQKLEQGSHSFDDDCDAVCNTCDYSRNASHDYSKVICSADEHWYVCECGAEKPDSREVHSGGKATCLNKAKCGACSMEYGELAGHSYAESWKKSDTQHWHECVCGDKLDLADHAYGDDGVCDLCGYEKSVQGGTNQPDDDSPSISPIVIILFVVVIGGATIAWVVLRKKSAK